jgi:hypothetical protein
VLFQNYTVDDFWKQPDLLNAPLTLENIGTLIKSINPNLYITHQMGGDLIYYGIGTHERNKLAIYGTTFSERLLEGGGVDHPEFVSINAFVYNEGLPTIVDLNILRDDFPQLAHLTDLEAAREAWRLTYNNH